MKCYVVFLPKSGNIVPDTFPQHFSLGGDWWAIGTTDATASDVCDRLGIDVGPGRNMIVVPLQNYYGRFDVAFWQKIEAWRDA